MEKWVKNKIIPKEKWIRTRDGVIQHRHREASTFVEVIIANTPQELVRVGDLVEYDGDPNTQIEKVEIVQSEFNYIETPYNFLRLNGIIAIYTPNKDKTQYTEQWRKL